MSTGFVVLPDSIGTDALRDRLQMRAPRTLRYSSGRPWIVGNWDAEEIMSASVGPVHVVVIGFCPVTTTELTSLISRTHTVSDVNRLTASLPGSFHLVAAVERKLRVQGSITGLRRVAWARNDGHTVISDRTDILASLTNAEIDDSLLATRVACGGMVPPPLRERSMWLGVRSLPPDHYLLVEDGQQTREVQWWQPPAPEEPLHKGAHKVRDALVSALNGREPTHGRLSSDLSGGLDSTSLTFLAARTTPHLLTHRWAEAEAGNDDSKYAAIAVGELPDAEHLIIPQSDIPLVFTDPHLNGDPEQPYLFARTAARAVYTARMLASHGSTRHIAGHGGDELFYKFPGYLHPLLRRRPLSAIRHLRAHLALSRWDRQATVAQLLDTSGFSDWWKRQAVQLTAPPPGGRIPPLSWGFMPLHAQPWVTGEALHAARATLRETAEQAQPFAPDRGQHQYLLALRTTAPAYAQLGRLFKRAGVRLEIPYLDDRVVEAALSVRLEERAHPWRYKPLLAEAMQGIVPESITTRVTKGEFSADLNIGLRRNRANMLDFLADSAITKRGLINVDALRGLLLAPQVDHSRNIALEHLVGCETWLRTIPEGQDVPTP
ncbi:lasso peptide isopeptide bond-forming cyclase [Streptomyces sp. SHP 1-2]|uniref:lasso peptide isopeptide bond-forming cyclase n=1 Tax=Streptomyces sp. SHP 1-2 TaxID=2769489 RepID=UPI0022385208|nr:lasso peptide isopeptide bond-forming cyclase [Streptomyces sp. SHP 1-2]MCW5252886.1 lasso peptide isopeptide bond-forming cyclase [Streptomyces sp. SHP 1-2]